MRRVVVAAILIVLVAGVAWVEESKIRRFMRYKLGKSDGPVEMEELGL